LPLVASPRSRNSEPMLVTTLTKWYSWACIRDIPSGRSRRESADSLDSHPVLHHSSETLR
jgi:hypothetical protein